MQGLEFGNLAGGRVAILMAITPLLSNFLTLNLASQIKLTGKGNSNPYQIVLSTEPLMMKFNPITHAEAQNVLKR